MQAAEGRSSDQDNSHGFWASLEHQLKYKTEGDVPDSIAAELKGIGTAHRTVLPKAPPLSQLDRNIFIAMGVCVVLALLAEIFLRELFMTPGAVMP